MDRTQLDTLVKEADQDGIVQLIVGAVVIDGANRVLLLKRPADDFMGGLWELPSGKVEPGEALDAALARELEEETALELTAITDYLGDFDYTSGSGKPSRQHNFAVTTAQAGPVRLTEHDEYRWELLREDLPVSDAVQSILNLMIAR